MTKPKKKPKTGDVVGWAVISRNGSIATTADTRSEARYAINTMNEWGSNKPYRLGRILLSK